MGVNNLLSFLRQTNMHTCAEMSIEKGRAYDLFVDLAIIIVPLMQRAKSVSHFEQLLQRTFDGRATTVVAGSTTEVNNGNFRSTIAVESNRLVDVIVGARRVSMYLDMFSPKMKIETHNMRNVKMLSREAATIAVGKAVTSESRNTSLFTLTPASRFDQTGRLVDEELAATGSSSKRSPQKNGDHSPSLSSSFLSLSSSSSSLTGNDTLSRIGSLQSTACHADSERCSRLNVVKLRDIRSMLASVILDTLAIVDRSIVGRCTIDTEVVGEGEIKCFRNAINRSDPRDVAILSNDNDIFLMMLIHREKLVSSANGAECNTFYRILINDTTDELTDINIQKISIDSDSVLRRIPASRRWCVLLWLICCSGTDFVSPLRPFSPSRRVEIFQSCLFEESRSLSGSVGERNGTDASSLTFNSFMRELKRFVARVERCCSKPVVRVNENPSAVSPSLRSRNRSLYSVSTWIVRLYWNLLYIIDLPVDFFRHPTFTTDASLPINSYVPNVYISFFLTSSVFKYMYDDELKTTVTAMMKFV